MSGLYSAKRKKERGQKRKIKSLLKNIEEFQIDSEETEKYNHFHVPCSEKFINSKHTNGWVKRQFCQAWLDKTQTFIKAKNQGQKQYHIVCMISYPDLWSSQIIIFYDEKYYATFWDRKAEIQKWTLVENKSLKEDLFLCTALQEKGYIEEICDEEDIYKCWLWFYGEFPNE